MTNIVYIACSLDGYIAGKNGTLDWLDCAPNPENSDFGFADFMQDIDALVMGRNTFDTVAAFAGPWPYTKPVFVLSTSMSSIPEGYQDKIQLLNGPLREVLEDLDNKGFNNLYIDGGKTIQNFLNEDLIDKMIITTIPVLLGGGTSLFAQLRSPLFFTHVKTEILLKAMVKNTYSRKR
ncbi:dihydrofolate reductase family protein [Psychromonas aquimarina]|uniref:dihydrofolate reductase family protein n=1 Tax=Psychromonas aquimarina TaxID=444919 RepID=UPI000429F99C|nr:dihydrofolate reductase family protein [Psychromonas aquimarina]